jgi:hypothetical protein
VIGPLDLPTNKVGEVAQALGRCLVDRGYSEEQIRSRLLDVDNFIETDFWERVGGPTVDLFAEFLDLTPFPEEDQ